MDKLENCGTCWRLLMSLHERNYDNCFVSSFQWFTLVIRLKEYGVTDIVSNSGLRPSFDTISVRPYSLRRITNTYTFSMFFYILERQCGEQSVTIIYCMQTDPSCILRNMHSRQTLILRLLTHRTLWTILVGWWCFLVWHGNHWDDSWSRQ